MQATADIFWSREPITGPKGTKEKPAIIPSFNDHRVVGLEIEQARVRQPASEAAHACSASAAAHIPADKTTVEPR